jgi:hypothetical protein
MDGEVKPLVADWEATTIQLDGLICRMGHCRGSVFGPLYIGKSETLGKLNINLSASILNLQRDGSKFARWGDNYACHIVDLRACVLIGHPAAKRTLMHPWWAKA